MLTFRRPMLLLAVLLVGCASVSPASPTATIRLVASGGADVPPRTTPLVRVGSDLTPFARIGGEVDLELRVSNVGPRDIRDLTIVVNDAYMAAMTGVETTPRAIRQDEQGGQYFTFGTLPRGAARTYVIRMSPNQTGDFVAIVDVVEWSSPDMAPLADAGGGVAEYIYETQVLAP